MSTQNQQNWNHNFMSFLAQDIQFTSLLTLKKHLFKYILITKKISETVHFIFLQNTTLHKEHKKIWFTKNGHL